MGIRPNSQDCGGGRRNKTRKVKLLSTTWSGVERRKAPALTLWGDEGGEGGLDCGGRRAEAPGGVGGREMNSNRGRPGAAPEGVIRGDQSLET